MGFKFHSAFSLVLSVLLVGISTTGAFAYLDAGTGSMILQLLLGGAAGLLLAVKLYWYKFLSLFGIKPKQSGALADGQAQADR